jgi:hypothetical protein
MSVAGDRRVEAVARPHTRGVDTSKAIYTNIDSLHRGPHIQEQDAEQDAGITQPSDGSETRHVLSRLSPPPVRFLRHLALPAIVPLMDWNMVISLLADNGTSCVAAEMAAVPSTLLPLSSDATEGNMSSSTTDSVSETMWMVPGRRMALVSLCVEEVDVLPVGALLVIAQACP